MLNNFLPEKLALYEIKWKNVVESERPQMTIQHRKDAICMLDNKEMNTHTHTHTRTHVLYLLLLTAVTNIL
jgi:hypothetical protein